MKKDKLKKWFIYKYMSARATRRRSVMSSGVGVIRSQAGDIIMSQSGDAISRVEE